MGVSRLIFFGFVLGLFFLVQSVEIVNGRSVSVREIEPIHHGVRKVRGAKYSYGYKYDNDDSKESGDNNSDQSPESDECGSDEENIGNDKVLVVILDGYRWDYYDNNKEVLPGFTKVLKFGVRAKWVNPDVPSLSSPDWRTINTGLTVEHHGIHANELLRSKMDGPPDLVNIFVYNQTKDDIWWQYSEPVWATAVKNGKESFCHSWERCDVPYHGITASSDSTGYSGLPLEQLEEDFRIGMRKAMDKFTNDGTDLAMVHADYPDSAGHKFGPESNEMVEVLINTDKIIGDFLEELETEHCSLHKKLNIIFVGDHGMTPFGRNNSDTQYILFRDFYDADDVLGEALWDSAFLGLVPKPNRTEKLLADLSRMPGVDCYKKEEIPEHYHFKGSPFVPPVYCFSRTGFGLVEEGSTIRQGAHGWPAEDDPNLRAMFFAIGPAFKEGKEIGDINMVDIHQVILKCLSIRRFPTDGDWDHVKDIFVNDD